MSKEGYVIVRSVGGQLEAWQSARGINTVDPLNRWSVNPDDAYAYKTRGKAYDAIERNKEEWPNEFIDSEVLEFTTFWKKNSKTEFKCLSDLLNYKRGIKIVYILEVNRNTYFYSNEEARLEALIKFGTEKSKLFTCELTKF